VITKLGLARADRGQGFAIGVCCQVPFRLPHSIALRLDREPTGRNHDAHRVGVRFHTC
jgi:hypothetical protein